MDGHAKSINLYDTVGSRPGELLMAQWDKTGDPDTGETFDTPEECMAWQARIRAAWPHFYPPFGHYVAPPPAH